MKKIFFIACCLLINAGSIYAQKTDADYFLAAATIRVSTGNDNKEAFNSYASFYVRPRKADGMVVYKTENYNNEIKINSTVSFALDRAASLTAPKNSLQYYKQNGLVAEVFYCNRVFLTDAWKIKSVSITLQFKDANGNPAPGGFASKTISFSNSEVLLGFRIGISNPFWIRKAGDCGASDQFSKMVLKTDEYFNPLTPKLFRSWENDFN